MPPNDKSFPQPPANHMRLYPQDELTASSWCCVSLGVPNKRFRPCCIDRRQRRDWWLRGVSFHYHAFGRFSTTSLLPHTGGQRFPPVFLRAIGFLSQCFQVF